MFATQADTVVTMASSGRTSNSTRMGGGDLRRPAKSSPSRTGSDSYGLPPRLPLAQRSVLAGKVAQLEGRLFDEEGRRRHHLSEETASAVLAEINDLRHDLGWLSVDLHHRHLWPEDPAGTPPRNKKKRR
jgi:hypothetical protein